VERTFIILKPDAIQRGLVGEIIARFERRGLKLVAMKFLQVSEDLARQHYAVHEQRPFFKGLIGYITSAPVVTVSANYTVSASDYTVFCNVTGAARTITLPTAASNSGRIYVVRRVGTGNSECTVTPVQGGTVLLDNGSGDPRAVTVQSDGTTWYVIAEAYR